MEPQTKLKRRESILSNIETMQTYKLSSKNRLFLFIILCILNILINMDHGTIPAASNEIKNDFKINDTELGSFGSLVYLGNLIGAILLTRLIDIVNRKVLTILTTITTGILLVLFINIKTLWFLFINRVLVGLMQSFITIYFPVWIDQFGPRSWKTIMLSIFNITSPLGVMFGYILTMIVKMNLNVSNIVTIILCILYVSYMYSGKSHI